jgi:hypothetical protein
MAEQYDDLDGDENGFGMAADGGQSVPTMGSTTPLAFDYLGQLQRQCLSTFVMPTRGRPKMNGYPGRQVPRFPPTSSLQQLRSPRIGRFPGHERKAPGSAAS